jgi:hypothetical protein
MATTLIDQINKGPGMAIQFFSDGSIAIAPADNNLVVSNKLGLTGFQAYEGITAPAVSAAGEGRVYYDSSLNQLLLSSNGGAYAQISTAASGGSVTSVSVTTAAGVSGTVATPTTTPAITITLGAINPTSVGGLAIPNTTWVQNSVLFVNPTGQLAQDVTNLNWNDSGISLGVGQSNPQATIDILGNSNNPALNIASTAPASSSGFATNSGAALVVTGGTGGANSSASANRSGGAGGASTITGGIGGAQTGASSGTAAGGGGGPITITGGAGGAATSITGTVVGGAGGLVTVMGGVGGTSASSTSGGGSSVLVLGGAGGANTTSGLTSGAGGNARIDAGAAGAASGGATSGVNGNVNIGNVNALNINIGNSGSTTTFTGSVVGAAPTSVPNVSVILPTGLGVANGTATGFAANSVNLWLVFIPGKITVTSMIFVYTVGLAATLGAMGLYTIAGSKVLDSGAQSTATVGGATITVTGLNTVVNAGWYYFAWTASSATVTWNTIGTVGSNVVSILLQSPGQYGRATNVSASGVLPATTGTINNQSLGGNIPCCNIIA